MQVKKQNVLTACEKAEKIIKGKQLDDYEIFGVSSLSNEIEVYRGEVENLSFADSIGLGIRVFDDLSIGYAYTSMLEPDNIEKCIESAIKNSKLTHREDINYLPTKKDFKFKDYGFDKQSIYSINYFDYDLEDKIKIAKDLERITTAKDRRVKEINNLIYEDGISEVVIINSDGFKDGYSSTACFLYLSVISEKDGDNSTGDYFNYVKSPRDLDIEQISDEAIERSTSILGAKKIDSVLSDVILEPMVASSLLGVIASTFSAESIQKGKSLFAGKLGEKIFNEGINLIDDGKLSGGMASRPFDAEGAPKGRTVIVEKGILKNFLYNTYTARKDKKLSTGNSTRSSYKTPPGVGISNFYIEPEEGLKVPEDRLIKDMDKGLYVLDIIGVHSGINPVSGEISVGAKGLWIEKGRPSYPVKEVTIATDIISLCKNIIRTGDDIKFMPSNGYIGSPSLLVSNISIGGK